MVDLFRQFWWLIFPIMGMTYGLVGMIAGMNQQRRAQDRAADLLRTYAEQGKEPPPELLKALSQGVEPAALAGGRQERISSAWWTFFVFIALTGGFGVGANSFDENAHSAFMVVMVVMGILAFGALVMALYATFAGRK
jgi:uncharacterized membrane protein YhaH (DUF805 family)